MLRRILIALAVVVCLSAVGAGWLWWHEQPKAQGEAYVGAGDVPLWDGTGQVRRRLARLSYGDKVTILDRYRDSVEVRTPAGVVGWADESGLLMPDLWARLEKLAASTQAMVVQARGHVGVLANLRINPGRDAPRIGQLTRGAPVEVLGRGVVPSGPPAPAHTIVDTEQRKEDWLLVRARVPGFGAIAGWVLGRFVAYDMPDPLPQYATSEGFRPVAWFELHNVTDPAAGPKPYYLVAGTRGPEGQSCDFTTLHVYTWSLAHHGYETAFVQNDLCGRLPVAVTLEPGEDAQFRFENVDSAGTRTLAYRMRSTIVRPVREGRRAPRRGGRRRR
ncbi:MAG TPA: SH3 domain-containing protein [Candidatus Acidoferrales bacterium]|nr:SH3 domain-containing protein [Candidatus Acidoferrales bacterium]